MKHGHDLLHLAREHIRSRTQTPTYLEHADRFSAAFLGKPLGVAPEYYKSVGTDTTIIDICYEALVPQGQSAAPRLRELTQQLRDMTDPSLATCALPSLFAQLSMPSCPLVDVARAVVAGITTLGHASLSQRTSAEAADRWIALWQDRVSRHVYQQQLHSGLSILPRLTDAGRSEVVEVLAIPAEMLRPSSTTFSAGVKEYLAAFSATALAGLAFVGALPFAERFSGEDLGALVGFVRGAPEFLELIDRLLRLAQDVTFDGSEPLNALVAAIESERRGRMLPAPSSSPQFTIGTDQEKMRREYDAFHAECRPHMDAIVDTLAGQEALRGAMVDLVEATCNVAQALTSAPHKARA